GRNCDGSLSGASGRVYLNTGSSCPTVVDAPAGPQAEERAPAVRHRSYGRPKQVREEYLVSRHNQDRVLHNDGGPVNKSEDDTPFPPCPRRNGFVAQDQPGDRRGHDAICVARYGPAHGNTPRVRQSKRVALQRVGGNALMLDIKRKDGVSRTDREVRE